ncbi:MAG: SDR family NAD(P)-dependent oxidoreductase, partial [Pseudomonadota bacterium]
MILKGRHILLTGGARGLGAVLARHLVDEGARLTIADLAAEEGRAVAAAVGAAFHPVDLGDTRSVALLAGSLDGALHGLVNNAAIATGIGGIGFEEVDDDTFDRVLRVNVRGTWAMTKACAPALRATKGRIVNIASDTALWGAPNLISYVASKGAVMAMTRALARELGSRCRIPLDLGQTSNPPTL